MILQLKGRINVSLPHVFPHTCHVFLSHECLQYVVHHVALHKYDVKCTANEHILYNNTFLNAVEHFPMFTVPSISLVHANPILYHTHTTIAKFQCVATTNTSMAMYIIVTILNIDDGSSIMLIKRTKTCNMKCHAIASTLPIWLDLDIYIEDLNPRGGHYIVKLRTT